jgi:hypothetical protein
MDFSEWMSRYRPVYSFFSGFLSDVELCSLRFVSKTIASSLPKSPTLIKKIPFVNLALRRGSFHVAHWGIKSGFYFIRKILEEQYCEVARNSIEETYQRKILQTYFQPHPKVILYCAMKNNSDLLLWAEDNDFLPHSEVIDQISQHNNEKMIQWAKQKGLNLRKHYAVMEAALKGDLGTIKQFQVSELNVAAGSAAKGGHLEILKYLLHINPRITYWNTVVCKEAVVGGFIEVLLWALQNGFHCGFDACVAAAARGNLEILKILRDKGCPWEESTCSMAAENGQFELLKWARDQNCPWDERTMLAAAKNGHKEIFDWAILNKCPISPLTCAVAAENGHLEILQSAVKLGIPWDSKTCSNAAKGGHLELLQWAIENGCLWDENTCIIAASEGHFEILKYAYYNKCPFPENQISNLVVQYGYTHIFQWLWDEKLLPQDPFLCSTAAQFGNLKILQIARNFGYAWTEWTCSNAALNGYLKILKWLKAEGCPWDKNTFTSAMRGGRLRVLKWLKNNGCPFDLEECERNINPNFKIKIDPWLKEWKKEILSEWKE